MSSHQAKLHIISKIDLWSCSLPLLTPLLPGFISVTFVLLIRQLLFPCPLAPSDMCILLSADVTSHCAHSPSSDKLYKLPNMRQLHFNTGITVKFILAKMQIPKPQTSPDRSETVGRSRESTFYKLSRRLWCILAFKNHWPRKNINKIKLNKNTDKALQSLSS